MPEERVAAVLRGRPGSEARRKGSRAVYGAAGAHPCLRHGCGAAAPQSSGPWGRNVRPRPAWMRRFRVPASQPPGTRFRLREYIPPVSFTRYGKCRIL